MIDAFHHVADQQATVSELWRVLQSGGMIVIEEPDIRATPVKIMAMVERVALMRSHFISPLRIAKLFNFSSAEVNIKGENNIAWIIIKKRKI